MFKHTFKTVYKQGLSLVELMILTVIGAILITMFSQNILGINDESKRVKVKQNLRSIEGALAIFRDDLNRYPTTEEGLTVLLETSDDQAWNGPYIREEILIDPWGVPYLYEASEQNYQIMTFGADRKRGGKGLNRDITQYRGEGIES